MIDKTLNYYASTSLGNWRNTLSFVADDPDNTGEFILQKALDLITQEIEHKKPSFNIKKIYADAHQQESSAGGELYPTVNEAINNAVETGTVCWTISDMEELMDGPRKGFWKSLKFKIGITLTPCLYFVTVTCEFARFDNPNRPSAGEYTLWNARGGTSHLISTSQ